MRRGGASRAPFEPEENVLTATDMTRAEYGVDIRIAARRHQHPTGVVTGRTRTRQAGPAYPAPAHRVVLGGDLYHRQVPAGAVDVTRPTRWQSPYPVARYGLDESLRLYRGWLRGERAAVDEARSIGCRLRLYGSALVEAARRDLAGRVLACWCPLEQRCHADVLLAVVAGGAA